MKFYRTMLAGTALALCITGTATIAGAAPLAFPDISRHQRSGDMLMLAQAEEGAAQAEPDTEQPRKKKRAADADQPEKKARSAEERAKAKEQIQRKKREVQADQPAQAEEQPRKRREAQADQPAQAEEQPRKKRRAEQEKPARAEVPSTDQPVQAEEQPRKKRRAEQEKPARAEAPATDQPVQAEEQPRKKRAVAAEQPDEVKPRSAEERAKAREDARRKKRDAQAEQPATAESPSVEEPKQAEEKPSRKPRAEQEQPANAEAASPDAPAQADGEQPRKKRRADQQQPVDAEAPSSDQPAQAGEEQPRKRAERRQPADAEQPARAEGDQAAPAEASSGKDRTDEQNRRKNRRPRDGGKAPILDSAKEEPADAKRPRRTEAAAPPPVDDRAAQGERIDRRELARADSEKGERIDREKARERRRERPEGSDVLREIGDRIVIQLGDQIMVEDKDRGRRIRRDARDVYYEELPRGRQREIVERRDGSRIVTIRDQYGDVIRRSRIDADGNEVVLAYVDEDAFERDDRGGVWRDPGRDLPPLELSIPAEEYILDSEQAPNADTYYEFLDQPPVEKVQRYYSVDEVKRSARIRDTVRRVDLDTITFEFGSADIAEGEVQRLDNVAQAMEKLLKQNPAETFLIEGHTDAVGSDVANLALSDRRAEAVAQALTDVFEIPPENLETQGYGEEYLKVNTDKPERQNRRVSIRRITPLVAPVVSAE
jgi:outer membrane protein OmpA-like peptidoglycan-associated protein